MHPLFHPLFEPRSIALIGASGEAGKNTARPQQFLRRHGWTGVIRPINKTRTDLFGEPAWPDLDAIPDSVDHAFVMVPAAQVAQALEACGRKRVPVVTIYSDGFAEAGPEGAAMQRALLSRGQARGTGFSRLVSVGNKADIGVGEIADMMVDDPHTDVVLLFLETLRDASLLAKAARRAHAVGNPLVAYKLGRSDAGAQLACLPGQPVAEAEANPVIVSASGAAAVDGLVVWRRPV